MKILLKILGVVLGLVIIVVIGGLIYFNAAFPDVEAPQDIKVEMSVDRITRGKYLAHHVTMCIDCHSTRDWTKFSGPVLDGTEGMGGEVFGEEMGFPGTVTIKNITPSAIGDWSDGELIRAITCGVNKNGEALFPLMPYYNFNQITQEDLYSIVAYVKSLHPLKNEKPIPPTELNFPLNFIVKTMPIKTYSPPPEVDKSNPAAYGKYMVTIASCGECHTQSVEGVPVEGMDFAGGSSFDAPWGLVKSANITPHPETGIGNWTKEQFIKRFKDYDPVNVPYVPVKSDEFNSIMPWTMYAGMSEEDLGAIYDYLRTVKPVYNNVTKFTPGKKSVASN